MKLVSWNVAGFRAVLKKGFRAVFDEMDADIFALQEVKAEAKDIEFFRENYFEYLNSAERKGYSGTLVYSKIKPLSIRYGIDFELDNEGRTITLEFSNFYLINVYVPNVKRDLSRLELRMQYEGIFLKYVKELEQTKPVIICGDFNVAHNEVDIKNAKANIGKAGFTNEEREKFTILLNSGLIDTFRFLYPDTVKYSWWSYITDARVRNIGWRLDYFVISEDLASKIISSSIYDEVYGSDHCPIGLEINL